LVCGDSIILFTRVQYLNDDNLKVSKHSSKAKSLQIHISCMPGNRQHAAILTPQGELFVSGDNELGQLGLGDFDSRHTFERVTAPVRFKSVALGFGAFTIAVAEGCTQRGFL
jgi:alpha-tubulin suppressor-like RCC1 family protein